MNKKSKSRKFYINLIFFFACLLALGISVLTNIWFYDWRFRDLKPPIRDLRHTVYENGSQSPVMVDKQGIIIVEPGKPTRTSNSVVNTPTKFIKLEQPWIYKYPYNGNSYDSK